MMNIIGQKTLINRIDKISSINFPRFLILEGPEGYGKKLICSYIAKKLNLEYIICDIKIDEIKAIINNAYINKIPSLYVFADLDKASLNAKNAILKVTEEPPNNAFFAITTTNTELLLPTLISRGTLFKLDPYSSNDIESFIKVINTGLSKNDVNILTSICDGPRDIDSIILYGCSKFYDYCVQILENIGEVESANALKIGSIILSKDNSWDLLLVFKCLISIAYKMLLETHDLKYAQFIRVTSNYKYQLNTKSINKLALLDSWIIEVRDYL